MDSILSGSEGRPVKRLYTCPASSLAIIEQDRDVVRVTVSHGEVGSTVAIHVRHHHRGRSTPRHVAAVGRLEGAIALAQEHTHTPREHHGEVEEAMAVDVAHRHGQGTAPGGEVAGGLERAVAAAQE